MLVRPKGRRYTIEIASEEMVPEERSLLEALDKAIVEAAHEYRSLLYERRTLTRRIRLRNAHRKKRKDAGYDIRPIGPYRPRRGKAD
jgi:hypothetical protein